MLLKALAVAGIVAAIGVAALAASTLHEERGYFSPQFTADGTAVVVIVRDVRSIVLGFGYQTFTPPARVYVRRDRFTIVRITLADGRTKQLHEFPASPLEGRWIHAYRPSLAGSVSAHLRWADAEHLEHEVAVTHHRVPTSESYVTRRRWDAPARRWIGAAGWEPGQSSMGGDERSQLHGTREVVAVRAGTGMPCAVLLIIKGQPAAEPLADTAACRAAHAGGYDVTALEDVLRRPAIERAELIERTHEELVREGLLRGLSEGDARLAAIRGMQQRGLYPKPTVIVARPVERPDPALPVFTITDEEFAVGLFPDIGEALDRPGEEVEKSIGSYVVHRDFDTSRRLNEHLDGGGDAAFHVQARGRLWLVQVERP